MLQQSDGRYGPWQLIEKSFVTHIDGGTPNSNSNVLLYNDRGEDGISPQIAWVRIFNRSGSSMICGHGIRLSKPSWQAGQWTHGTTTFTDDTTDFQDVGTGDAPLETTTNNDGFLVAAATPFNGISLLVSTASTGSPTRILEYSIAGGAWASVISPLKAYASTNLAVGEELIVFSEPVDWEPMSSSHGTGVPVGKYGFRMRATTAPTVAAVVTSITVHKLHVHSLALGSGGASLTEYGGLYAPMTGGDAVVAFQTVKAGPTIVQMLVRLRG